MCKSPSRLNGLLVSTEARVSAGARVQNGAQLSKAKAQWTVSKGAVSRPPCLGPSPKALAFSLVTQPSFVSQYPNNSRDWGRGASPAEPAPRETRWSGTRGLASKPVDSPPATGVSVFCSATRGRGNAICVTAQRSGFTAMAYG